MAASSVAPALPPADRARRSRERLFPEQRVGAAASCILVECVVFGLTGHNFVDARRTRFEITRLSVEIGLLALALTPIIVTGGIDLSVGSMMGLAAVVLGALWRDAGCRSPLADRAHAAARARRRRAERAC